MSDNVKVKVLDIDAQKSTQSIADLKKQIRDLKGQLVGLSEGTEEYNRVLAECADKTHQLKEIQEQVSRSSADFGDRMSNVRGVISGMSGAVGAVTGALALMGVEADKDSKLMKTMVAAMSITSGVQAIDAGVKSFKALTVSIKASTAAMTLFKTSMVAAGVALAAFAAGWLIWGKNAQEAKERMEEFEKARQKAAENWRKHIEEMNFSSLLSEDLDTAQAYLMDFSGKAADLLASNFQVSLDVDINDDEALQQALQEAEEVREAYREKNEAEYKQIVKEHNELLLKGVVDANWKFTEEGIEAWNIYYSKVKDITVKLGALYMQTGEEEYNEMARIYGAAIVEQNNYNKEIQKNAQSAAQKAQAAADKALQNRLKLIKDAYNLANATAKLAFDKHEIDEENYYKQLYDNLVEYNNKVKAAQKQTAAELAAMQLAEYEAAMKVSEARIKAREEELEHLQKMNEKPMVQRSTAGDSNAEASENREMTQGVDDYRTKMEEAGILERMRLNEEYQEWLTNLEDTQALARLQREAQALREELEILTQNKDNQLANIMQRYDGEKEILDARLSENLISQEEYDRQLDELNKGRIDEETALNLQFVDESAAIQAQITATERDAAMQRIEISEKERQKKIENVKKYMSAATSALSMSSQLISALQENLDTTTEEGFEQNKKYEMANATISFLQGLISAWSSAMELGPIAGPIAGGVLTALLTAIYGANIAKIQSTTLNSGSQGGGASMNKVTLQSIEHPISNVRQTTTASDYEELNANQSDTRVYVLASDIEEVTGQRRAQVSNATY